MTSLEVKHRLINYLNAWGTKYTGAVYEAANVSNADVIGVKYDGKISEFEIKVSKADLRGELAAIRAALVPSTVEQISAFPHANEEAKQQHSYLAKTVTRVRKDIKLSHTKIMKHRHYLVEHVKHDYSGLEPFYPNSFYFAVPGELVAQALEGCAGLPYGVFNVDNLSIEKPARSMRSEPHGEKVYRDLFNRACTQRMDVQRAVRAQNHRLVERIAAEFDLLEGTPGALRLSRVLTAHHAAEGLDTGTINPAE